MQVDHKDGNGLDCRKANLRICTSKNNHRNNRKWVKQTYSQFKGVTWDKSRSKWIAQIGVDLGRRHLGRFANEEDAARAYDTAARELFGEFARPNFPCA